MTMESERDLMLDGNAVAGMLHAMFGEDMTETAAQCASCGTTSVMAQTRAYLGGPGIVLRCPACTEIIVRIAQTPRGTFVDVRGARHLRFP
jgi:uncharacterized protein DUF6510